MRTFGMGAQPDVTPEWISHQVTFQQNNRQCLVSLSRWYHSSLEPNLLVTQAFPIFRILRLQCFKSIQIIYTLFSPFAFALSHFFSFDQFSFLNFTILLKHHSPNLSKHDQLLCQVNSGLAYTCQVSSPVYSQLTAYRATPRIHTRVTTNG